MIEKFYGTYEAKAPISHGSDEDFGMEQRLRTLEMAVRTEDGVEHEEIPVISGNGLRGYLRDLLAEDFFKTIDVEVHDILSNAFYSGGTLERGSGKPKIRRKLINNVRENLPMISLLGTALGSQMIKGKLDMGMLIPIAEETENFTGIESNKSVFEFVDETFYTRKDDREGEIDRDEDEQAQQMKYNVQVLTPGTRFYHWMTVEEATDIELACLGRAFELFNKRPFIGGMKRVGHGKVEYNYDEGLPDSEPYKEFLENNKEDIKEFIEDLDDKLEG